MITETNYHGWKAIQLETDSAEIIVPSDIGPRVISIAFKGQANLFYTKEDQLGGTGETDEWKIRGGHRLWHAPEEMPRTYFFDHDPISVQKDASGEGLDILGNIEEKRGFQKHINLLALNDTTFRVTHTLTNVDSHWPIRCAPWALSVMAPGGYCAIPLLPKGNHENPNDLLPQYSMVHWSYSDFSHPMWTFSKTFIGMDQSVNNIPQKIGLTNYAGWAAYWQPAGTFVVAAPITKGAEYPDNGCVYESFSNEEMLELETLAPMQEIPYGESAQHVEHWGLFKDLPKPDSEDVFTNEFRPVIESWLKQIRSEKA